MLRRIFLRQPSGHRATADHLPERIVTRAGRQRHYPERVQVHGHPGRRGAVGRPDEDAIPANNSLASQLQQIAQIIQVRQALGVTRQIFFAGLENFDTHAQQLGTQSGLLAQLSPAMAAFYQATQELGVGNEVTTFTMSDFSRAMQPNSTLAATTPGAATTW